MNKRSKIFNLRLNIAFIVCCSILLTACRKKFAEINTDRNTIATVGTAELPFLFARAQGAAIPNVWQYQSAQGYFADLYAQYFAMTTTSAPNDRLVIAGDVLNQFNPVYTTVVPQLQTIMQTTDPSSSQYALANIIWVLAFHRVTDYWGPIPYFHAGEPANSVPYDPQDKVYDDFFKRLDASVTVLKGKTNERPYGNFDLMYGGDVNKWIKFANTLRLRLALRISKADPARAKTEAEAAYANGVLTNPVDDAFIKRSREGDDLNGLSVTSPWGEYRMSAAMESVLKGYQDPRISEYFLPVGATGDNPQGNGQYNGIRNGLTTTQLTETINTPGENSNIGRRWAYSFDGGLPNNENEITPTNVMYSAEAYFLRAEGALLGWNMGGTAKDLYEAGITTSFNQWGITDATIIQNYINSTNTPVAPMDYLNSPPVANIPVKSSTDINIAMQQIFLQKWLCLFPDGAEAWADYRRNRVLPLYPVVNSDNPDITNTTTQWTRRIPFLLTEKQNNGAEVEKAINLLGGPDKVTTPLWWDKN